MANIWIALAGAMGAAGVALAALAAHGGGGAGLDAASQMLLFHAAAVLAGAALLEHARLFRPALLAALAAWVIGSGLFSADIARRALAGARLFPMAAPIGGTLLIAAWLALMVAGVVGAFRTTR